MDIRKTDVFLLPNLLTILRLLTYPFIFHFLKKGDSVPAVSLIVAAASTDVLDGFLARTLNQVSDLGKIMDPFVDKLGIGVFIIYATLDKGLPLWACILVIAKEALVLLAGLFIVRKKRIVPVSAFWGKLNSWVWAFVILCYVLELDSIKKFFLGIGVFVILMTALSYGRMFIRFIRG